MKRLLTIRKQAWASKFKPDLLRGAAINPNYSVAARYNDKLDSLIRRMTEEVERSIHRLYKGDAAQEFFAQDASIASQARIMANALKNKYEKLFSDNAQWIAESFTNQSDEASSKAVHMSAVKLSGGLSLSTAVLTTPVMKNILKATITENVLLIKSIPEKYLNNVMGAVQRSITTGNDLADLVPYLAKNKEVTYARAKMIAHDQTRKAMNGLSKGRMEQIGVKKYEWLHTGGSNAPREDHIKMSGNIYSFDDPPVIDSKTGERGIPGQAINCRCRMLPVIDFGTKDDEE